MTLIEVGSRAFVTALLTTAPYVPWFLFGIMLWHLVHTVVSLALLQLFAVL